MLIFSTAAALTRFGRFWRTSIIGDDPLEQFQRSAAAVITAFGEPGALQRTIAHPCATCQTANY
jgi:hypothetical protein